MANRAVSFSYEAVDDVPTEYSRWTTATIAWAAELGNAATILATCLKQLLKLNKTILVNSVITLLYFCNCKRFQNLIVS